MFWCTNPSVPPCPRTFSEPFRCGSLITEGVRAVFRYERNNTSEDGASDHNQTLSNSDNSNISEMSDFSGNITNTTSETKDMVREKLVIPQRAGMTRIVNGEDCLPGECPWQVINLHN